MILRNSIAVVGIILLLITVAAAIDQPAARAPAVVLALLVAGVLFENRRYRRANHPAGLAPTNERFIDPETGQTMRVWANTEGDRRYIEE